METPPGPASLNVAAVMVAGFIGLLNVAVMERARDTPTALFAGSVELTTGRAMSGIVAVSCPQPVSKRTMTQKSDDQPTALHLPMLHTHVETNDWIFVLLKP